MLPGASIHTLLCILPGRAIHRPAPFDQPVEIDAGRSTAVRISGMSAFIWTAGGYRGTSLSPAAASMPLWLPVILHQRNPPRLRR